MSDSVKFFLGLSVLFVLWAYAAVFDADAFKSPSTNEASAAFSDAVRKTGLDTKRPRIARMR